MQPYQYKPLPSSSSIRILILHPAVDTSSALECDIITNDRLTILRGSDNKTFDAVSYVWGHGAHDIPLYCKSETTCLYISAVVDEMLRSLREAHKERRLWVDALCLNQKDNEEKSIQVQQMGQIYHMADKVHIWLGPAEATTPLALAFLRTLVVRFEPLPGQAKDPTTEEILRTFEETLQHRNFPSFLGLLQKSWFTRRWTLQEGFLARDAILRCGSSKISWHWFNGGLELIRDKAAELPGVQRDRGALYALEVLKTLQKPADLLSLLWTFHMSECSDPRDRIYSLLGLAQDMKLETPHGGIVSSTHQTHGNSKYELPIADYALSLDVVFGGFVRNCISTGRLFQILLHIDAFGRLSEVSPNWPSWIPNWTRARARKPHSPTAMSRVMPPIRCINRSLFFARLQQHQAHPCEFLYVQPTEYSNDNHHGLVIYGKSFQKISKLGDTWTGSNDDDQLVKYLADWIHQEVVLHIPGPKPSVSNMEREVEECLSFLITGSEFFGYAKNTTFQDLQPHDWWPGTTTRMLRVRSNSPWPGRYRLFAEMIYPIVNTPECYTLKQVRNKEHLNVNQCSKHPITAKSQQVLSDLLDGVSNLFREGNKRLIVASCGNYSEGLEWRPWIAPSDVRMGDVITDITHCGSIGTLLRPTGSPYERSDRPAFQLIGIVWSLHNCHRNKSRYDGPEEFLIL